MLKGFIDLKMEKMIEMKKFADKISECDISIKSEVLSWLSVKINDKYSPIKTNLFLKIITCNQNYKRKCLFETDDSYSINKEDIKNKGEFFKYRYAILNDDSIYFPYDNYEVSIPFDNFDTEMLDWIHNELKYIIKDYNREKSLKFSRHEYSLFTKD